MRRRFWGIGRFGSGGRLLGEFLVGLGLLFLVLLANLVILKSASQSSSQGAATYEALSLAKDGMEQLIALAATSKQYDKTETFSSRNGSVEGFVYTRKMVIVPAVDGKVGKAVVLVRWGQKREIKLERYVCVS